MRWLCNFVAFCSCAFAKTKMLTSVFVFFLAASLTSVLGQEDCSGVMIGELPTLFHEVSGTLYAEDDRSFCIQDFNYDGLGPDAFLYFYYPGDEIDDTGGGVYVPLTEDSDARVQFPVGTRYTDEILRFTLPENVFVGCDFEGFGIWCRYANQLFTSITWNTDAIYSETATNALIQCVPSPGRRYAGSLGDGDVQGLLYIVDDKTMIIRDFLYNGEGNETFLYWFGVGEEASGTNGNIIPVSTDTSEGQFDDTVYDGTMDFTITITDMDVFTCDIGTFTIWDREASETLASVTFTTDYLFTNNPLESAYRPELVLCNRPSTRPGVLIGELPTEDSREASGTFYVQDSDTFFIQLFSYGASREDTYLYYYPVGETPDVDGGGKRIPFSDSEEALPTGRSNSYFNNDFTIDLSRADVQTCEIGYFTIYDEATPEHLTMIAIPANIFVSNEEDAGEGMIVCVAGAPPLHSALGMLAAIALLALTFRA